MQPIKRHFIQRDTCKYADRCEIKGNTKYGIIFLTKGNQLVQYPAYMTNLAKVFKFCPIVVDKRKSIY